MELSLSNRSLNFFHEIPIEVFHETNEVYVKLSINNFLIFEKTFLPGILHCETIKFYKEYDESCKNIICFDFFGNKDAQNKFIKIKSISINNIWLNLYNANYKPLLNPEWWDSLTSNEQENYLDIIHGKNGNTFGWFGKVFFEFAAGYDRKSKIKMRRVSNINEILSSNLDWVYLDNYENSPWEKKCL